MKPIVRNSVHSPSRSHDFFLINYKDKKVKFTYESYNAVERFSAQIYDGYKWKHLLDIMDLGIVPNKEFYIKSATERKERSEFLYNEGVKLMKSIF